jgi:hypothetical protein
MLGSYSDFLDAVDTLGVMAFAGSFLSGFPTLDGLTSPLQWHTGDPETDPWRWKDRAAAERRLAFGNILGGRKGFISNTLYPLFSSACRPDGSLEERYRWGHVKKLVCDVYNLFEGGEALDTGEIRKRMNVRKSENASAVDGAVVTLQKEFYITVCGSRRKVSFDGAEYGWPANAYRLADDWLSDWLTEPLLPTDDARARILAHLAGLNRGIDLKKAEKLLFGKA